MASPTKKLDRIRRRKAGKQGRKRKSKLENHGTTQSYEELFGEKKN